MKLARLLAIGLLGVFCAAIPVHHAPPHTVWAAQTKPEKKEVKVWVNTNSSVYHCPGTRWYGKTKLGKYMGECAAIKDGNRPAYGKACGSSCK